MEKLTAQQATKTLQRLLTGSDGPKSSRVLGKGAIAASVSNPVSSDQAASSSTQTQLQLPSPLRQILAQSRMPTELLPIVARLQQTHPLPVEVQRVLNQSIFAIQQTQFSSDFVTSWFQFNPIQSLLQGWLDTSEAQETGRPPLWLQQVVPLLLLLTRPHLNQSLFQRLLGRLGLSDQQLPGVLMQVLREIQSALQQVRLSQIAYVDSAAKQEPDYYMVLPWTWDESTQWIELLLKRRQAPATDKGKEELWVVSMRLQLKAIGPILARLQWDGEVAQVLIYTENDTACTWLKQHIDHLQKGISQQGIRIRELDVQTGHIPASLAPSPHQFVHIKV